MVLHNSSIVNPLKEMPEMLIDFWTTQNDVHYHGYCNICSSSRLP